MLDWFLKLESETVNPYQEGSERRQVRTWEDKDQNPELINRTLATDFGVSEARILPEL